MKFMDAFKDHSIQAVRLPRWADKNDRVELPPVHNGARGPWCKLVYIDVTWDGGVPVFKVAEKPILVLEFAKDDGEYEVYAGDGHPEAHSQGGDSK